MIRDIKYENMLLESISKVEIKTKRDYARVISSLCALYDLAGDETVEKDLNKFLTIANEDLKAGLGDCVCVYGLGNALYKAYAIKQDGELRNQAIRIAANLFKQDRSELGHFVAKDGKLTPWQAYEIYPFYMNYESLDGKKEHYNDAIAQVRAYFNDVYEKSDKNFMDASTMLACLLDTCENTSQQLYEIFDELRGYARKVIADIKEKGYSKEDDANAANLAAYGIYKACRMKLVLAEKYEEVADSLFTKVEDVEDTKSLEIALISYVESLKTRKYQDYGRNIDLVVND